MDVFCHIPRENWIVDRIGKEFCENSKHKVSFDDINCDIIWILAPWCWKQIPVQILNYNKVICTIHHEVPEKFDEDRKNDFLLRDQFVNHYHVPCQQTHDFIRQYTNKPITILGYWLNNKFWKRYDKFESRKKLGLQDDKFIVGSFQRDTEGSDLKTPKLEKGPDLLCKHLKLLKEKHENLHVLLGSWRRQYVINCLNEMNIEYTYKELPTLETINLMYNACDLYVVSSRFEGGPQALLESSYLEIPIVTTNVGMSKQLLSNNCIFDITNKTYYPSNKDIKDSYNNVLKYELTTHIKAYDKFLNEVYTNG
jgi:glycosyltransferase involved in cell wall biosynthesis